MTDVRTLLHDLAADAPRGHGEETADRVVELHRAQDRRRLRLAGVAVAIAVVVAAVPALVTRSSPADTAAVADAVGAPENLFDVPTRGSLAGDDVAVAAALAADWDDGIPYNDAGAILDPEAQDRHVAFVGEVPGGQVWALVLGRTGTQLAYAWFADVEPVGGVDLQLATVPARTAAGLPLGLVDVAGVHGPLVVVALPDQGITLLPTGADDAVPPDVRSVEVKNGVMLADVGTTRGALPGFQVDDAGGGPVGLRHLDEVDTDQPLGPERYLGSEQYTAPIGAGLVDADLGPEVQTCLQLEGWSVTVDADGTFRTSDPLSTADASEFDSAVVSCLAAAAAGQGD